MKVTTRQTSNFLAYRASFEVLQNKFITRTVASWGQTTLNSYGKSVFYSLVSFTGYGSQQRRFRRSELSGHGRQPADAINASPGP
jgi:hypothetical protein